MLYYSLFVVLITLAYILIIWRYLYYWHRLKIWNTPVDYAPQTFISVIVPVRNEATNISACVHSILNQFYPSKQFELIVVDDHSTDATPKILAAISDPRLQVLSLAEFIEKDTTAFKKKALSIAIERAQGDLIVTTDGDCIAPNRWLQRIAHLYETEEVRFIAAPVNFYREKNLLERFQSLDFTGMMGITGAGIEGRFMNMCNGANLAYDKAAFYEVKGFEGIDHLASGDDMLLMQKIAQRYPGSIAYLKNAQATILTPAQASLQDFFEQRIRWASKSSDYKEWQVTFMLGLVWLFCMSMLFSLGFIFLWGIIALYWFLIQLLAKSIMDYLLLRRTTSFFNRPDLMRSFIPSQLMHIIYIIVIGTLSIFIKKYNWKGRLSR